MPEMDAKLQAEIADDIYTQLKADLMASGFELVPEATLLAARLSEDHCQGRHHQFLASSPT